jgi:hypothetical protein
MIIQLPKAKYGSGTVGKSMINNPSIRTSRRCSFQILTVLLIHYCNMTMCALLKMQVSDQSDKILISFDVADTTASTFSLSVIVKESIGLSENRSFSVSKLQKINLRSRMGEERLTSLTLTYIYSDTFDMQSIATKVLQDFFLTARKTCCAAATK